MLRSTLIGALCGLSISVAGEQRLPAATGERVPLFIHATTFEFEGKIVRTSSELEAILREVQPAKIVIRGDPGVTYSQVRTAMEAIQRVGGIDMGLVGNKAPDCSPPPVLTTDHALCLARNHVAAEPWKMKFEVKEEASAWMITFSPADWRVDGGGGELRVDKATGAVATVRRYR